MSGLEERVTAVLAEHEPVWAYATDELDRCDCGHGHDIAEYDTNDHRAHVAAAVIAALNLTEERENIVHSEPTGEFTNHVVPQPKYHATFVPSRRWVTAWEPS